MSTQSIAVVPITILVAVGVLLVVLGLFTGGSIELVMVGLLPIALAAVLGVAASRGR